MRNLGKRRRTQAFGLRRLLLLSASAAAAFALGQGEALAVDSKNVGAGVRDPFAPFTTNGEGVAAGVRALPSLSDVLAQPDTAARSKHRDLTTLFVRSHEPADSASARSSNRASNRASNSGTPRFGYIGDTFPVREDLLPPAPQGNPHNQRTRIQPPSARYLEVYQRAANSCRTVGWPVLAAIGDVESAHGRYMGPSSAGALGPAQFMPATWTSMVRKGWAVDGNKDGRYDIFNPVDAFPTAAVYLCKSGATSSEGIRKALWHYNHSTAYVDHVSRLSWSYAAAYPQTGSASPREGAYAKIFTPFRPESDGLKVVATARRYLGVPYRWGGTDPKVGLDCSALVQLVYRQHGVSLPRVSQDQARMGSEVSSLAAARAGDLLYFAGPINHIGIYVGDGLMLHAPRTGEVVKISKVWKIPTTIRRVLQASVSPELSPLPVSAPSSEKIFRPFPGAEAFDAGGSDGSPVSFTSTGSLDRFVEERFAGNADIVVEVGDSLWVLSEQAAAEGPSWAWPHDVRDDSSAAVA